MRVVVLGCGPAGLIAAHAAARAGADVRILSKARKSYMKGAQYLHAPIPGVPATQFRVEYLLLGTPAQYREKVYGRYWDGTVSPEDLDESHDAWDIREAYDWLWDTYGAYVCEWDATPARLQESLDTLKPDLTFSTIPAPLLCSKGHPFRSTQIWSTDQAFSIRNNEDNTVICNGEENPAWYRSSLIHGWGNTEWPGYMRKPPITPMWEVIKPTDHQCSCFPTVNRVGRYGAWRKGVLSHEGFDEVTKCIHSHQ